MLFFQKPPDYPPSIPYTFFIIFSGRLHRKTMPEQGPNEDKLDIMFQLILY